MAGTFVQALARVLVLAGCLLALLSSSPSPSTLISPMEAFCHAANSALDPARSHLSHRELH